VKLSNTLGVENTEHATALTRCNRK